MNKIAKELIKIAQDLILAQQLIKIAQQIEQFTGAQANLYRDEKKLSIEQSKQKILDKYVK